MLIDERERVCTWLNHLHYYTSSFQNLQVGMISFFFFFFLIKRKFRYRLIVDQLLNLKLIINELLNCDLAYKLSQPN